MSAYQNLSQSQEFVAAFRKFNSNKTLINSIVKEKVTKRGRKSIWKTGIAGTDEYHPHRKRSMGYLANGRDRTRTFK